MAYVDVELELQVLRVNVGGIIGDVREVKARQRCSALQFQDVAQQRARYDRLQQRIERIEEHLTALERRCSGRLLATVAHADDPAASRIE